MNNTKQMHINRNETKDQIKNEVGEATEADIKKREERRD